MLDAELNLIKADITLPASNSRAGIINRIKQLIDPCAAAQERGEVARVEAESIIDIANMLVGNGIPMGHALPLAYEIQQGHEHLANITDIFQQAEDLFSDSPTVPDKEFCHAFRTHAQNATHAHMQQLWANQLAQEVNGSSTFSARTMAVLDSMSWEDAVLFEKLCSVTTGGWVGADGFVYPLCYLRADSEPNSYWNGAITDRELREIRALGLIDTEMLIPIGRLDMPFTLAIGGKCLILNIAPSGLQLRAVTFNRAGAELARLCKVGEAPGFADSFAEYLQGEGIVFEYGTW